MAQMAEKTPDEKKAKQREYAARHYRKNREAVIAAAQADKARRKKLWSEYKATLSCAKCGFSHPAALDFHHKDPATKEHSVHYLTAQRRYAKAREEVKKCIVLCANCHRIHHYNEKGSRRSP